MTVEKLLYSENRDPCYVLLRDLTKQWHFPSLPPPFYIRLTVILDNVGRLRKLGTLDVHGRAVNFAFTPRLVPRAGPLNFCSVSDRLARGLSGSRLAGGHRDRLARLEGRRAGADGFRSILSESRNGEA